MVNLAEYIEAPAEFLTPEFVKDHIVLLWEITGEGEWSTSKEYETTQLVIPLCAGSNKKLFTVNKTNARFIESQTKKVDSKNWVGKLLQFEVIKLLNGKESIKVKLVK